MSLTVEKQREVDAERRRLARESEDAYQEKIRQLQEWREERARKELRESDIRMQSIEQRLSKSQRVHSFNLTRRASEAKLYNEYVAHKMVEIQHKKVQDE